MRQRKWLFEIEKFWILKSNCTILMKILIHNIYITYQNCLQIWSWILPIRFRYIQFVGLVEKANTSIFRWKSRHVDFRWKSRHVDFSLEKPTRRFFGQKADKSILVEEGHSSGPSLNYYYLSWDPLTLANQMARSLFYLYVLSDIVSSIIHLSYCFF